MKSQKGFAALESLLIVVIIAIVGGTGWYVMRAKNNADITLSQTTSSSVVPTKKAASTKPDTVSQKYLVIKEWGVELPLPANIQDAVYGGGNNSGGYDSFRLSTTSLSTQDPQCGPDQTSVGYILRQTAALHDTNLSNYKDDPLNYPVYDTKIGDYYYSYQHSQAACSNKDSVNQEQVTDFKFFETAFAGIKSVN